MIDHIREQIQQRLDQLAHETDRLRKALAALDPRSPSASAKPPARKRARAKVPTAKATESVPAQPASEPTAASPRRTAPGVTKAAVLAALAGGEAMTAGQVADKSGVARATVSTTLSKLAKSGEIQKAERGYRLAPAGQAPTGTPAATGAASSE